MNERKLLIDTDTRHTTSSALQHSESFTSLTPFVGKIKIEHFSFLRWLVNFDSHCILLCVFSEHSNDHPFYFFTLPTHDLVTIDSDDLLTCFSSRTPFPRLPFPCTLPYSS